MKFKLFTILGALLAAGLSLGASANTAEASSWSRGGYYGGHHSRSYCPPTYRSYSYRPYYYSAPRRYYVPRRYPAYPYYGRHYGGSSFGFNFWAN